MGDYLRLTSRDVEAQQAHCSASSDSVAALEAKLRRHYGMKHALCVSNATTALYVLGLALGLKGCDFVTTPLTYGATVAGLLLLGNRPVFADVEAQTMTLSAPSAARALTPETKAIISVDVFGTPADGRALRRVADKHGLWLISDSAQSLGAARDGRPAGAFADALVTSFTAGKTLFAGEGGAIVTDNPELYEKLIYWSQHPLRQRRELGLYLDNEFAFNARISPLSSIWANSTFEISLHRLRARQRVCRRVLRLLDRSDFTEPASPAFDHIASTFFRLAARWKGAPRESALEEYLSSHGVRAAVEPLPVRLLYQQPHFLAQQRGRDNPPRCANAERLTRRGFVLSLRPR